MTSEDIEKLKDEAIEVLREVKALRGRCYKSYIRQAWMTGNYRRESLEKWDRQLQNIRNILGPGFLAKVKIP